MTDIFDRASEHEAMHLRHALEEQRAKARLGDPARWQALSAERCEAPDCDEPIPDDRRRLLPGVRLCVDCAERVERYGR